MTTASSAQPASLFEARLLIDGVVVAAASSAEIRSPASDAVIGSYALAHTTDVERAVTAATRAFASWSARTPWERETVIRAATAHVRTLATAIGRLMALEQGKPLKQSVAEVIGACDCIDYYAAEGVRVEGEILAPEKSSFRSLVTRQPVGVVAAITPWNYPVALLSWKLGPALAAGCPVIVKPTPVTPLSPFAFCAALQAGGLPNGVLQFLTGDDVTVGTRLVTHPQVAKIAFTGSTATGRTLMSLAGPLFKRITLELGGNCPAIVTADADLPRTAKAIAYKAFRNQGQSCSGINRIYAHATIHDRLVDLVAAEARALTIGDGLTPPDVDLGPMTTRSGRDRVQRHVADALAKGGTLITGGVVPADRPNGNFYAPTVLTGLREDWLIHREETFGPVAPCAAWTDLDDVIRLANATEYGLCSFIFTGDVGQAMRISERLDTGTVCVNHVAVNTPYAPYEGWKASGVGVELSRAAIGEYLHRKHLKLEL